MLFRALQTTKLSSLPGTLYYPTVKCISTRKHYTTQTKSPNSDWITIYKLPLIRWAVALNKIKIYQAGLAAIAIPSTYALETASQLPNGFFLITSVLGITGTITLFFSSSVIRNLIGFIYIDSTKTRLRIAYVDFWGRRKNIELDHTEIEPPSDQLKFGVLSNVTTQKGSFKLLRRMGQISDPNVFSYFFGE